MAESHFDIINSLNRCQAHLNSVLRMMKAKENNMPDREGTGKPSDNQPKKNVRDQGKHKPLDVETSKKNLERELGQSPRGSSDVVKPEDSSKTSIFETGGQAKELQSLFKRLGIDPPREVTNKLEAKKDSKRSLDALGLDRPKTLSPEKQQELDRQHGGRYRVFVDFERDFKK